MKKPAVLIAAFAAGALVISAINSANVATAHDVDGGFVYLFGTKKLDDGGDFPSACSAVTDGSLVTLYSYD